MTQLKNKGRSLKLPIEPGDVLYDPYKDILIIYSGWIVQDTYGQDALFCHNQEWSELDRTIYGRIYTCWVAERTLVKVGAL